MKKLKAIPAVVMLTAGVITCLVSIFRRYPVQESLVTLLAVLVIFYLLGCIAGGIISRIVKKVQKEEEERLKEEERLRQEQEAEEAEREEEGQEEPEIEEEADGAAVEENWI